MNNEYVVVRFADGDQVITELLNETNEGILILRPITVNLVPVKYDGAYVERMMTALYCPMSDQESFVIDHKHVVFVNRLHPKMINNYIKMSKELYSSSRFEVQENNDNVQEPEISSTSIVYH